MQPASALSLLLFLQLGAATPMPNIPSDCYSSSCRSMRSALRLSPPATAPTTLTEPHFPPHQLHDFAEPAIDNTDITDLTPARPAIDNTDITPAAHTRPAVALSADQPLSSAYLLSLSSANPPAEPVLEHLRHDTTAPLTSKPTSALPQLRKEDVQRYWRAIGLERAAKDGVHHAKSCGGKIITIDHYIWTYLRIGRDNSDLFVVGIVLLFLAAIVAIEASESICDLSAILTGRRRVRRGEIFLHDDDDETFYVVKKPFYLQSPPTPRYKIQKRGEKCPESDDETPLHSDCDTDQFEYDSDAPSRV